MSTYRAAYHAAPQSTGVVLTAPEHASLPDDNLRAEAMREAESAGLFGGPEQPTREQFAADLRIGEWKE